MWSLFGQDPMTSDESSEVREVWDELQGTDDPDSREFLLERLAELALQHHDFSDCDISEDTHECFEALRRAREEYHLVAVKVGRLVARILETQDVFSDMTEQPLDDSKAN